MSGMQHSPQWATMTALAPTLAYDTIIADDFAPIERASHLATPTYIIVGENSPASIHAVAEQLRDAIPNVTYTKIEGEDHLPNPEVVLPLLTGFLKP